MQFIASKHTQEGQRVMKLLIPRIFIILWPLPSPCTLGKFGSLNELPPVRAVMTTELCLELKKDNINQNKM